MSSSAKYNPSLLSLSKLMVAVLGDTIPESVTLDAIFIHGAPIRDDSLDLVVLEPILQLYRSGKVKKIVLNGLTAETCLAKNLAYGGFEAWQQYFLENGVSQEDILILLASGHTAAESTNFLLLSKEEGWQNVGITSHVHHVTRCFLQIVKMMETTGVQVDVYAIAGPDLAWDMPLKKPVMGGQAASGGGDVDGTFTLHFKEELDRTYIYAQALVEDGPKFTPHATIEEGLAYLADRSGRGSTL